MTVRELIDQNLAEVVNAGEELDRKITKVFCCDLLSIAMGRAPAGCVWVTVMANINTLAVASLADAACIVLAEGARLDENAAKKAEDQGITVLASERPIFDLALSVHDLLMKEEREKEGSHDQPYLRPSYPFLPFSVRG